MAATSATPITQTAERGAEKRLEQFASFSIPQRAEDFTLFAMAMDSGVVAFSFAVAVTFAGNGLSNAALLQLAGLLALTLVVCLLTFFGLAAYNPDRSYTLADEARRLVFGTLLTPFAVAGAFSAAGFILPLEFYTLLGGMTLTFALIWRTASYVVAYRTTLNDKAARENVLIVGTNEMGEALAKMIDVERTLGKRVIGFVGDRGGKTFADYPVHGSLDGKLFKIICEQQVDEIIVTLTSEQFQMNRNAIECLRYAPLNVKLVPAFADVRTLRRFRDVPFSQMRRNPISGYPRMLKRAFDIAIAGTAILAVLPVLALIGLAVTLDSRGGMLFVQRRMGQGGVLFPIFKFRSMVANADKMVDKVKVVNADGDTTYKIKGDARITKIGHIIRKTSLDELPQLFNVLRGDMSIVGPRPETLKIVNEQYQNWQYQRLFVPQGITGWWQVNGRSEIECYKATEQDLYYIENYSFWLDIKIILMTIPAILRGKGAI